MVIEDEAPLIYGLEYQCRALCSQNINSKESFSSAAATPVRFLVGTQSLKKRNQVHLIEYIEEFNTLSKAIFKHNDGEIWHISTHSKYPNYLATCYSSQNKTHCEKVENKCSIWKFPIDLSNNSIDEDNLLAIPSNELIKVADFCIGEKTGRNCIWHPDDGNQIINEEEQKLHLWDVESAQLVNSLTFDSSGGKSLSKLFKINNFRWSPHSNCSIIGAAIGNNIHGKDLRCKSDSSSAWILNASSQVVRDLDFNPNAQYYLATCGDDCEYKFWDVRKPSLPALVMNNHSHWVWSIRYNQFHDQLVLTCSSDSRVLLSRITSLTSQPYGHLLSADDTVEENEDQHDDDDDDDDDILSLKNKSLSDEVISTYEEHEDSVYAIEWSTNDPWIFASLSYDGRLVINRVPKREKISILF